ncbi:MAG: ABC transporter ATP-binding protein [Ruminococcaceae bacterium]|nr:ABC transporter ATP-binding protein [Oscillospiraceae bacterium]
MGGGGPRGGGPRGGGPRGMGGKPKDVKKTIGRLLGYVGKYKVLLFVVLIFMMINTVMSLVGGYMTRPIINRLSAYVGLEVDAETINTPIYIMLDSAIESVKNAATGFIAGIVGDSYNPVATEVLFYIMATIMILVVIYLFTILTNYLQARVMMTISQNSVEKIRNDLFNKLQKLPVRYFDTHPTGEVMSRFTNDVDNIDVMLNNSLTSIVSGVISLVGTFVFMITTNIWLTVITIVFVPFFAIVGAKIAGASRKYYSGQQAALGAANGYIEETVTGQKVVKVFNHENTCCDEFETLNEDLRDKQMKAQFYGGIMGPIMHNTSMISYSVTIGVGGILMVAGKLDPGALQLFAQYSKQFSMPINNISQQTSSIFSALAGAERVFAVMDEEPETLDADDSLKMKDVKGEVIFKDVTFGYNPDKVILKNLSLYAKPGQKIAFVGSTGAGKTTVTNLLSRFYEIDSGEITIDGVNIKDIKRDELRSNIAMVLQDTHLFTGTVMENIRYGRPDATDDEVVAAAKTASAHSFIMRLENGYDTMLEGDGANLSQGQRQLLNIARAALSKAPILVLDEATSSVDTRTERHIEHGMDRLMKTRTTFVIAHRLSTVRNSNAIMVLEAGKIIERGTHEQLLELKGRYYELYTGKRELD